MEPRRTLTFTSLGEVMPEVDRLLDGGHATLGKWSFAQICNHLTKTLVGSIDGIPFQAPWLVRKALGAYYKRKVLRSGRMPAGAPLPEAARPKPNLDDRAEAEALRAALRIYSAHSGPVARHPFFGQLTRDEWTRLHCIHCAHHLSFIQPSGVSVAP